MKTTLFTIVIMVVLCAGAFAQSGSKADEAAVIAVLQQFGQAFENGDIKSTEALMTENVVHIDPFGEVVAGRAEVLKRMTWVREVPYGGKSLTISVSELSINFLDADTALVTMRYEAQGNDITLLERVALNFVRVKNDWKLAFFQPTVITKPPARSK